MSEDKDTSAAGGTFTQEDVDRIVRERLARERDKFKDYDDLKAKASEADATKSDMDKVMEKLAAMEKQVADAERKALLTEVAAAKGLTPAQAKRLQGSTKEELEADADDLLGAFGGKSDKDTAKDDTKDGESKADESSPTKNAGDDGQGERKLPASGRPTEKVTSGAVPGATGGKSAAEMAKEILSSSF